METMKYEILYNTMISGKLTTCVCTAQDSKGRYWGFTITEEQAKDRVAALKEVGIEAWYNEINNSHWVNDGWID